MAPSKILQRLFSIIISPVLFLLSILNRLLSNMKAKKKMQLKSSSRNQNPITGLQLHLKTY